MRGRKNILLVKLTYFGKKNRLARIPAAVAAALFLKVFYGIGGFFFSFREHPVRMRCMAGVLCVCLIITSIPFKVSAQEIEDTQNDVAEDTKNHELISFPELPGEIREQEVEVGTPVEELALPDTLTAVENTVIERQEKEEQPDDIPVLIEESEDLATPPDGEENMQEEPAADEEPGQEQDLDKKEETEVVEVIASTHEISIEGITWISAPEYDGETEGLYVFSPVIAGEYSLKEGTNLPEITVAVGDTKSTVETPSLGVISEDTTWTSGTLSGEGTLTVEQGVVLTLTGAVTINGKVTIEGGGTIERGDAAAYFSAASGTDFSLKNITVDGCSLSSVNSMILMDGASLILDEGCVIQNCIKDSNGWGGAVDTIMNSGADVVVEGARIQYCQAFCGGGISIRDKCNLVIEDAVMENCTATGEGGAICSNGDVVIKGGTFRNNKAYGDIMESGGGCIYHCIHEGTITDIRGGYFQGNVCGNEGYKGSGAIYTSTDYNVSPAINELIISGNVHFAGDGVSDSGTDGIMLDQKNNVLYKIWLSDALSYPLTLYVRASEGRVIAEGKKDYILLQNRDMKKINFVNIADDEIWYALLDKDTNQIRLTSKRPSYMDKYFVYYISNGASGIVKDDNNNDEGYSGGETITVQSADGLSWPGRSFIEWNKDPDGNEKGYQPGDTIEGIDSDINLYAIFAENAAEYRIEHYKQNTDGQGYTLSAKDTAVLRGAVGKSVTAIPKTYPGFTENTSHPSRISFGTVTEDGALVLKLYYDLMKYNISFNLNEGTGVQPSSQTILYGNCVRKVPEPSRRGYSFKGWYKDKEGTGGNQWDFNKTVENNTTETTVALYAKWIDDIAPVLGKAAFNTGAIRTGRDGLFVKRI